MFPYHMRNDFNQITNLNMAYYSLGSELSDVFPQLHAITGCDTTLRKFRVGKFCIDKTAFKKKNLKTKSSMIHQIQIHLLKN